jgi:hypothetical protein
MDAMQILDYTSYDEVRATLGVSDEELEDVTLALPMWASELQLRLEDVSSTLETLYGTVAAKAENVRTVDEQKLYKIVRLYSMYCISDNLLTSLPMFSFKSVSDGKSEKSRPDKWEDTRDGVRQGVQAMLARLRMILAKVDGTYSTPTATVSIITRATGLAVNPITSTT